MVGFSKSFARLTIIFTNNNRFSKETSLRINCFAFLSLINRILANKGWRMGQFGFGFKWLMLFLIPGCFWTVRVVKLENIVFLVAVRKALLINW